jgi:hypothetical protein
MANEPTPEEGVQLTEVSQEEFFQLTDEERAAMKDIGLTPTDEKERNDPKPTKPPEEKAPEAPAEAAGEEAGGEEPPPEEGEETPPAEPDEGEPVFETLEEATSSYSALKEQLKKAEFSSERRKRRLTQMEQDRDELRRGLLYQDEQMNALRRGEPSPASGGAVGEGDAAALPGQPPATGVPIVQLEDGSFEIPAEAIARIQHDALQGAQQQIQGQSAAQQRYQAAIRKLTEPYPADVAKKLYGAWNFVENRYAEIVQEAGVQPQTALDAEELIEESGMAKEFATKFPDMELDDVMDLGRGATEPIQYGRDVKRVLKKYTDLWAPQGEEPEPTTGGQRTTSAPATLPPKPRSLAKRGTTPAPMKAMDEFTNVPIKKLLAMTPEEYQALKKRMEQEAGVS